MDGFWFRSRTLCSIIGEFLEWYVDFGFNVAHCACMERIERRIEKMSGQVPLGFEIWF